MARQEFIAYEHLADDHPDIRPPLLEDCRVCQEVAVMARFVMAGTSMYRKDGTWIDPADLHAVRHYLERPAGPAHPAVVFW